MFMTSRAAFTQSAFIHRNKDEDKKASVGKKKQKNLELSTKEKFLSTIVQLVNRRVLAKL